METNQERINCGFKKVWMRTSMQESKKARNLHQGNSNTCFYLSKLDQKIIKKSPKKNNSTSFLGFSPGYFGYIGSAPTRRFNKIYLLANFRKTYL